MLSVQGLCPWFSSALVQDQEQRFCTERIWSSLRDSLQLWAKVHWGNKEAAGGAFKGAPGSHKKRRDREISNRRTRLL